MIRIILFIPILIIFILGVVFFLSLNDPQKLTHPLGLDSSIKVIQRADQSISIPILYSFKSFHEKNKFYNLINNVRCLVCQNESISNSRAKFAIHLKNTIYNKLRRGESSKMIIHDLIMNYGDRILYRPPVQGDTYILWLMPFLLLFFSFGYFYIWRDGDKYDG